MGANLGTFCPCGKEKEGRSVPFYSMHDERRPNGLWEMLDIAAGSALIFPVGLRACDRFVAGTLRDLCNLAHLISLRGGAQAL